MCTLQELLTNYSALVAEKEQLKSKFEAGEHWRSCCAEVGVSAEI